MRRLMLMVVSVLGAALIQGTPVTGVVPPPPADAAPQRPNIVLVLMDDFSLELLRAMPEARRMSAAGASYTNAHVVDSLCCPSRAALLTGRYPHQTGVLLNTPQHAEHPIGGFAAYQAHGNPELAFNVALQRSGYTTGFIGKYLNGYEPVELDDGRVVAPDRMPGWSDFQVFFGGAYNGWGFWRSSDAEGEPGLVLHRTPPARASRAEKDRHYVGHVMTRQAVRFLQEHADDPEPFFLEVAPYAPHNSQEPAWRGEPAFPPAFRDRPRPGLPGGSCGAVDCRALDLAWLPGYDDPPADNAPTLLHEDGTTSPAPAWRLAPRTLTDAEALRALRDRARMVQSIDRMLARIRATVPPDTYVVLTSDNGYHLGQHGLNGGKGTPYDSDTHVPLVVEGPGVVPGARRQLVNNVDLAPTFEQLAGLEPRAERAGSSFAASLHDPQAPGKRFVFMEHTWALEQPGEVDADHQVGAGVYVVPSWVAVRSARGLLVRVDLAYGPGERHAWELYRYDVGWEDVNVFVTDHDQPWARALMRQLEAFDGCVPAACRALGG